MKILVINCGSSSAKFELIDMTNEQSLAKGNCERIGIANPIFSYKKFNNWRKKLVNWKLLWKIIQLR